MLHQEQLTVRQANALAKSAQQMELNEKRLILIAMSQIKHTDTEFLTQDIPITDLAQWFGGNPYQEAQKAADGLLNRVVFIQEEDGAYKKFQWTTLSEYIPVNKSKDRRACIRVRLNEELKPLLLQLQNRYNSIPLAELLPIPSFNSQRLYEILWADSFAGDKTYLSYKIEALKTLLGLRDPNGKWEKYAEWRDFKKVLARAKRDFEEYGALRVVSFKGVRHSGRAFTHVSFSLKLVYNANQLQLPFGPPKAERSNAERELAQKLSEAGYAQNPLEAIDIYGAELIAKTLDMALDAEKKARTSAKPIHNLGGLITHMLRTRAAERQPEASKAGTGIDIRRLAVSLAYTYSSALSSYTSERWTDLSSDEQAEYHDLMRVDLEPILLAVLDKSNWQGPAYESARNNYFSTNLSLPAHLKDIRSFANHEHLFEEISEAQREAVFAEAETQL